MTQPYPLNTAQPGMVPQESIIFNTWWNSNYSQFDRVEFNVRVGQPFSSPAHSDPAIAKMALDNARKRIDAIAWQGDSPTIIEVKFRAQPATFGQILAYAALWRRDTQSQLNPFLQVLAFMIDLDTQFVLNMYGIKFALVPADFSVLPPVGVP